jgi:hypothetical protein
MKLLLPLALLFAFGCSTMPEPKDEDIRVSGDSVMVTAVGKPNPKLTNTTQRRAVSRDAALVTAQEKLRTYIWGIKGPMTVGERVAREDRLKKCLSHVQTIRTRWESDDSAVVIIRLPRSALGELDP